MFGTNGGAEAVRIATNGNVKLGRIVRTMYWIFKALITTIACSTMAQRVHLDLGE